MNAVVAISCRCLCCIFVCAYAMQGLAATPFERSLGFIDAGQITEARRALRSELKIRPDNIEARYNLALLLQDIDQDAAALLLYKQNLGISWHLPSVVNLVDILQQQGQSAKARWWLLKATKKLRHEAVPWYLLAALAEKSDDAVLAKSRYAKAIKADPLNGFAWLHLAEFQSRQQRNKTAMKSAAKAMRLLTECAPCWRMYGEILAQGNAYAKALAAFQRSFAIQPSDKTRQLVIATLRSLGENQRADMMQRALN